MRRAAILSLVHSDLSATLRDDIQEALQDQGYYAGEIDGQLGQQTRDALAAYQRDHNLELTAAIDEATVQALGLTTAEEV